VSNQLREELQNEREINNELREHIEQLESEARGFKIRLRETEL
jgi:FtsZ-binding cell division protein ZapB